MFVYLYNRYDYKSIVWYYVTGYSQTVLLISLQIQELKDSCQVSRSLTGNTALMFASENLVP